jgi:uncharacterized protein YjgD (DUF1641 family)
MTKKEAIKRLEKHDFGYAMSMVVADDFETIETLIKLESATKRDELLDRILKSYLRSHKLSLIASNS